VRTYCGHGIGKLFHTAPNVPHYAKNKAKGVMAPGHIFTIEPMINEGAWQVRGEKNVNSQQQQWQRQGRTIARALESKERKSNARKSLTSFRKSRGFAVDLLTFTVALAGCRTARGPTTGPPSRWTASARRSSSTPSWCVGRGREMVLMRLLLLLLLCCCR